MLQIRMYDAHIKFMTFIVDTVVKFIASITQSGMTALIAAVTKNLYEVAEILIYKGAHVNASSVRKHTWL